MCGICASIGSEQSIENVVDGLKKLEYRGYDSSGIAIIKNKKITLVKAVGQIKNLEKKLDKNLKSSIAIGHTRWATHGVVSEENAHPHISHDGKFCLVHNGIIENFQQLKKEINVPYYSQTDSEVLVNLIAAQDGDSLQKLMSACKKIKGSYAVAMLSNVENKIYLARHNSPLMVVESDGGCMAASDISVFAGKYDFCYIMADGEFAVLDAKKAIFFDKNGKKVQKEKVFLQNFDFSETNTDEKCFMQSEILQQSVVLRKTYFKYFTEELPFDLNFLKNFKSFHFVACGTAYHASLLGAKFLEEFCKKPCEVSIASEFRYKEKIFPKNCLYIFVSQSGETADTIACAKLVKEHKRKVLSVTNVPYSTLNTVSDFVLPTFAGKEVAVASTKAYTAQVFTLLIFAQMLGGHQNKDVFKHFVCNFENQQFNAKILEEVFKYKKIFFIGRGQDYITALEGALKLKEIAYLPCMGLAAGELKHGTLALIDQNTLVIAISTQKSLKEKIESNILEVRARGGKVLILTNLNHNKVADLEFKLADFEEYFMSIVSVLPLQHLALQYCLKLGYSPDKPRNLAKSVTVE